MNETQKPFVCAKQGCEMAFTNEDHLNVHKKKHDMALHLGIDSQNNTVADQTPTPTRFIRNCEEVGLFQDLQNVNPFDETFRKATELVKSGSLHIPESSSDDTLHTPHIFPYIEEKNQASKFSRNNSNEPEFTVTTIDDDFLRLNEKKDLSLAEGSNDSEDIDRNDLLKQNDLIISTSNDNTLISKDSLISNIAPTAIPVPSLFINSDIPPVVVNNLSDIQIFNNNSKNIIEKSIRVRNVEKKTSNNVVTVKSKLIEALNNRVKKEESESDDCDNMVIQEIENSALFASNVSSKVVRTSPKKVVTKHSNKEKTQNKIININTSNTSNTRTVFVTTNTQAKKIEFVKKTKSPISQSQLERQRELNRAAQVRSRQRKKNSISQMEVEISLLHKDKSELIVQNQNLKNEVLLLKTMLMYHKDCAVSKDPKIMEEINAIVKTIQDDRQRVLQKEQGATKKVVPIRPNSTNVIALTPVPSSVFIQVPTPVAQSIKIPTTTSLGTPITLPCSSTVVTPTNSSNAAIQIAALPTILSNPTVSSDCNIIRNDIKTIPQLMKSTIVSNPSSSSPENTSLNVISKLSDDLNSTNLRCTNSKAQNKVVKAKDKLHHKKKKAIINSDVKPANIIKLPNAVLPKNNFFILAQVPK